jgi:NAD-dependent SIR2 family protein deacetylase
MDTAKCDDCKWSGKAEDLVEDPRTLDQDTCPSCGGKQIWRWRFKNGADNGAGLE